MGADDFIRKPFSHRLLVERVKVLLRRPMMKTSIWTIEPSTAISSDCAGSSKAHDVEFDMVETLYGIGYRYKEV